MHLESIAELKMKCQVTREHWHDQPWVNLLVRRFSIYLTWLLLRTKLPPNAITILGIASSGLAALSLASDNKYLAIFLILFTVVADFSDGEVARYTKQTSLEGVYLDKVYIFICHPIIFAGLAVGQFTVLQSPIWIICGFICCIGTVAYAAVIEYAKSLVTLAEIRTYLSEPDARIRRAREHQGSPKVDTIKERHSPQRNFLQQLIGMFDFPAVFLLMILALTLDATAASSDIFGLPITASSMFLACCATAYPLIIIAFLAKNVIKKEVYREVAETFSAFGLCSEKYNNPDRAD